jgi:phosphoglycerate dehydrogenase-like enzyme
MSAINKKKIYLYGFNSDQLKIIKARNSNALFIAENKITKIINSCSAIIAPTRKSIETALEEVDFKRNNKLKWIHLPGSGVEKYSRYFKYKKINFTNGKGIQNHQISDHAIGLLLCLTRKINLNIKYDQNVKFDKRPIELNQKKVVIVGFGGNGKMIAEKLLAFKMNVSVVNDTRKKTLRKIKFFLTKNIQKAVKDKDVIIISTPLTKFTKGLIDKNILRLLARGAIVVNVSRSSCLNLKDLILYLKNKHLGGAGLDVVEGEPIKKNHELFKFKNVIVTPHTGGISDNFYNRNLNLVLENIKKFINSKKLTNLVDTKKGY